MRRIVFGVCAAALVLGCFAPAADAAPKKRHAQRHVTRHWHGYGFLPGYRPPEVVAREETEQYWSSRPRYYGPAWPGFYRGRWNGGGFGPCYTQTPIGPYWNCGK